MPTLSAIVPTFNRKDYLLQALAALKSQTRPVDEIIVWDDGSSDGTKDAVTSLNDPKILYQYAENAGKSAALNQAMQLASGDYIWICDDDDLALPKAAEYLGQVLDENPTIGIAGGRYDRFEDTTAGHVYSGAGYWPDLETGTPLRHLLEDIFLFQNATLVRRSCYDRVGTFREDLARSIDYDMIIRLATRYPVHMRDEIVFLQRKHDGERGPANFRHAASSVDKVWAAQDKIVFEGLRDNLPLSLLEAMYHGHEEEVQRTALIERACIFARHGLWGDALSDLEVATGYAKGTPLGETEFAICRRAVSGKHGVQLSTDEIQQLKRLKNASRTGRQIVRSLGRGLLWSLRQATYRGDLSEVIRLGGIISKTGIQMDTIADGATSLERRTLALGAYDW